MRVNTTVSFTLFAAVLTTLCEKTSSAPLGSLEKTCFDGYSLDSATGKDSEPLSSACKVLGAQEALESLKPGVGPRLRFLEKSKDDSFVLPTSSFELDVTSLNSDEEVCAQIFSVQFNGPEVHCLPARDARVITFHNLPYGEHALVVWARHRQSSGVLRWIQVTTELPTIRQNANFEACSKQKREEMLQDLESESRRDRDPSLPSPQGLAIIVLVSRGGASFQKAAASWASSGLLSMATHRYVFLQNWQNSPDQIYGTIPHHMARDARVDLLPQELNFQVLGSRSQLNIGPALNRLVNIALQANVEHVLFIEEDFQVNSMEGTGQAVQTLREAQVLLRSGKADIVKLRHRLVPGEPFYPSVWKTHEKDIFHIETPYISNHSALESVHWLIDPSTYWAESTDERPVWSCHKGKTIWDQWFCSYSTHSGWSNNPFLLKPALYKVSSLQKE